MTFPMLDQVALPESAWNPDAGYQQLAFDCVLPLFECLDAGAHDADALLCAAFSPLVHAVLDVTLLSGAAGLRHFLKRLCCPPHPATRTCFCTPGTAWVQLDNLPAAQVAAAFDLRPGGGPELEPFPYVPLLDRHGRIPPLPPGVAPTGGRCLARLGGDAADYPPTRPGPGAGSSAVGAAGARADRGQRRAERQRPA